MQIVALLMVYNWSACGGVIWSLFLVAVAWVTLACGTVGMRLLTPSHLLRKAGSHKLEAIGIPLLH